MNNKVCKEYIREIKTVFPVKSKQNAGNTQNHTPQGQPKK